MATLEHFLFNSDYPTDKIVFMQEGEVEVTGTWTPIHHFMNTHIPVQLYADGDYKLPGSNSVYPMDGTNSNTESNTTTVMISFMYQNECWLAMTLFTFDSSLVGKKISYRTWAYCNEETAKNIDIGMTTNIAKPKLALTSDDNYPRFVCDGFVTQGQTYAHNLGFVPFTKTWSLFENTPTPLPDGTTAKINLYQRYNYPFFGDANGLYVWKDGVVQVSDTTIKTYLPDIDPDDPDGDYAPDGVYFRMYRI